jgi:hypothetical protein
MNDWNLGEYTSAEDVPFGFYCYEMQVHLHYPPDCIADVDVETDFQDDVVEDQELPDCLLSFTQVIVIGYVIANSNYGAIDFTVKHFGADSIESLVKNYFLYNDDMMGYLIAEDDEDKFEYHKNEEHGI